MKKPQQINAQNDCTGINSERTGYIMNNCHAELYKVNRHSEASLVNLYASAKPLAGSASLAFEIPKRVRNDKSIAFTLAEVLITLTIIGVIAAITIPNLMQSWRKHERITQIKTAYSIIQNATKMAVAEYGNPDGWSFNEAHDYAPAYFIPYVKVQKKCGTGTSVKATLAKGCFVNNNSNGTWNFLNGNQYSTGGGYGTTYYYTMILENGMHVAVWAPAKQNQHSFRDIVFLVDVDGKQGPTTLGKDIFTFRYNLDTGKFTTGGNNIGYNQNDCSLTNKGMSCAYWIEKNHWEFPDDYPVKKF